MLRGDNAINHNSPLIVELVGPAGAGKTVLSQALSQRVGTIAIGADLELRNIEHIPIFVGNAPFLLPVLLRRSPPSKSFTWDDIKAMVYLRGWPRVLRRQAGGKNTAILLDHGPVFKLAKLLDAGPERLKIKGFEQWWQKMLNRWASTLDLVIWLDAPDSHLMERINTRNQRHVVKGKSEREASEFLTRYRTYYEQILAKLTAYGRPSLLKFNTSQASIEQIVDEVLLTCNLR